jgi:hypothetical protein
MLRLFTGNKSVLKWSMSQIYNRRTETTEPPPRVHIKTGNGTLTGHRLMFVEGRLQKTTFARRYLRELNLGCLHPVACVRSGDGGLRRI